MAEGLPYTLLSLPRYARIMGIHPVHFQGAVGQTVWALRNNHCSDVWVRESWQYSDHISRRDLAQSIYDAEWEIARILGYHPAPRWIAKEMHRFPPISGYYAPSSRPVNTTWGKLIQQGRRATTLLGTATTAGATLVYSDPDGDGFSELATVTLAGIASTVTEACEVKVYNTGHSGQQEWEIRPFRSKTLSGGTLTATFDSWLFIDPDLQGEYPGITDFEAIDISTTANYVATVDIYREYTDISQASAEFFWEGNGYGSIWPVGCCSGVGCCAVCGSTTQEGCLSIRDVDAGVVVPVPATYDSDTAAWNSSAWTICDRPGQVKLWYYAGDLDEYTLRDGACEYLSDWWAQTIAWVATCRLERELCSCSNVNALADKLREDLAYNGSDFSHQNDFTLLGNPLGTRRGEMMAWKRISRLNTPILYDAAVVL